MEEWWQITALIVILYLIIRFVKKVAFRIIGLAVILFAVYYLVLNYL